MVFEKVFVRTDMPILKVDVVDILSRVGFSKSQAKRLLGESGVSVWDTQNDNDKWWWYKRPATRFELMDFPESGSDKGNVIIVGNSVCVGVIPLEAENVLLREGGAHVY